jgi:hypothetical protein
VLAPHDRKVLLEALRPPDGYRVDRAIAATYSLDLVALLFAPLAFSLFDAMADREKSLDSLALLRAVREHATRLSVFCQAEGIARPGRYPALAQYLEEAVVPVTARHDDGVFHVKLWVLRFVGPADEPVHYRVLVPSRNLTFDCSWDTLLILDGDLVDRQRAFAGNHPLADLVAELPRLALKPPSERIESDCRLVADELRRVDLALPDGVDDVAFFPLGIDRKQPAPFDERIDRLLVVSPFLSTRRLETLAKGKSGCLLVSRVEELAQVRVDALNPFAGCMFVLDDAATPDEDEDCGEPSLALTEPPPPTGLHAKLYVADSGRNAHIWTGSANATEAAFTRNVELLVKLSGKKSQLGIDRLLNEGGAGSLRTLLREYKPGTDPTVVPASRDLDLARLTRSIATAGWSATVHKATRGSDVYDVVLASEARPDVSGVRVEVWPITLAEGGAQRWSAEPLRFEGCSIDALTPFFAFRVVLGNDAARITTFVVRAELVGAPLDRPQRLLHSLFRDPARLSRFLELLLEPDPLRSVSDDLEGALEPRVAGRGNGRTPVEPALFEMLVRALCREPARLEQVKTLLDELGAGTSGHALLSEDFQHIWTPIWQAYEQQREKA